VNLLSTNNLSKSVIEQIRLPLRGGGMGLRPTVEVAYCAHLAAGMGALHHMRKENSFLLPEDGDLKYSEQSAASDSPNRFDMLKNRFTLLRTVLASRRRLIEAGVNKVPKAAGLVPATDEALMSEIKKPIKEHLQRKLTIALDHCRFVRLYRSLSVKERARLHSLRHRNSSSYLLPAPIKSSSDRKWSRSNFKFAICHRLGLPVNSLQSSCVCNAPLKDDPAHFHVCRRLRHRGVDLRHRTIANAIASLSREAGFSVEMEPTGARPRRTSYMNSPSFAVDISNNAEACEEEPRKRGDILLTDHQHTIVIDVSVVHPASSSNAEASIRRPGSAADKRAQAKRDKYSSWVRETFGSNAKFLPVVLESFGASAATGVQDLVKIIAEKAEASGRFPYKLFCSHAAYVISTALHQGNAAVYNHALLQLRSSMNSRILFSNMASRG
jgi:hypothetical protein